MRKEEYKEYLQSNDWKDKRLEFLEEEDYECERCGSYANQVHHLNYENVGDEEKEDVEVLCWNCHMIDEHKCENGYGEY